MSQDDWPVLDWDQWRAYSHECISAGFWPGNGGYGRAAFYAYAAPVPPGLDRCVLSNRGAFNTDLGEFILDYDQVRCSPQPDQSVLDFLANTHAGAADTAGWDRTSLDRTDRWAAASVRSPALAADH